MGNSWQEYKFSDAPFAIIDGDRGKNYPKQNEFFEEGYCLFLNANNVTKEGFAFNSMQFITKEKDELLRSGKLKRGDIVVTTRGTIGNVAYYNDNISFDHVRINSGMVIFRCDKNKILPAFLFQILRSPFFYAQINALKSGVAQPQLPICDMKYMTIRIPSLTEQRKISSILSAYDDLIENNTRRIQILEEMAQLIYQEWFVDFRFPGHEKAKFVDSELGKIPEGWEVKNVNDIIDIQSGFAFKSKSFSKDGKYGLVTIKNVQDGKFIDKCESCLQNLLLNMPEYCLLETGDILLSLTGNIGRVCLVYGKDYILNQRVAKLVPKVKNDISFIYFLCRQEEFRKRLEQISTGVAQQNLSPIEMGKLKIIYPSLMVCRQYAEISISILREIVLLFQKNRILRTTRDLLLPKLISGELDVSDLDIAIRTANGGNDEKF
jgi:type I restriction enzyme S subunit